MEVEGSSSLPVWDYRKTLSRASAYVTGRALGHLSRRTLLGCGMTRMLIECGGGGTGTLYPASFCIHFSVNGGEGTKG